MSKKILSKKCKKKFLSKKIFSKKNFTQKIFLKNFCLKKMKKNIMSKKIFSKKRKNFKKKNFCQKFFFQFLSKISINIFIQKTYINADVLTLVCPQICEADQIPVKRLLSMFSKLAIWSFLDHQPEVHTLIYDHQRFL